MAMNPSGIFFSSSQYASKLLYKVKAIYLAAVCTLATTYLSEKSKHKLRIFPSNAHPINHLTNG